MDAANWNAKITAEREKIETTLAQRAGAKGMGATRADFGAAGVRQGGSASDVLRESARDIEFQLASISKISGMEQELFRKEAKAAQSAGRNAMLGGILGAVSAFF